MSVVILDIYIYIYYIISICSLGRSLDTMSTQFIDFKDDSVLNMR